MSSACSTLVPPGTRHATVRRVRAAWRALTGGSDVRDIDRRTLVACSGGADSAALVLALAGRDIGVAHIVHDIRPAAEAAADRDAVRALAEALGLPFQEASVTVSAAPGNTEANAARARYDALTRLARESNRPVIATAHHADDQLETMLMRLARGSGVRGMRGIAPRRRISDRVLVRPMLSISRRECRELCDACGFVWREDPTNNDLSRTRAAIRHTVVPALLDAEPRAAAGAGRTAGQMRAAARLERETAQRLLDAGHSHPDGAITWPRALVAAEPIGVAGAALRLGASRLLGGMHADARPSRSVHAVIEAVRDASPHARRFVWRGVVVTVDARSVRIERTEP